jgi:hypothetical protein
MQSENFLDSAHGVTFHSATVPPGIARCRPLSPHRFLRVKTGLVLAAQVPGMCAHVTPECAPTLNRNPCPDASGICNAGACRGLAEVAHVGPMPSKLQKLGLKPSPNHRCPQGAVDTSIGHINVN